MILFGNILYALAKIVELADGLLTVYKYILIAAALITWVNPDPYNPIVSFLYRVTEPLLSRIRRRMPAMGPVDLSPVGGLCPDLCGADCGAEHSIPIPA